MLKRLFFILFGLAFYSPFLPNSIFVRADGIQDLSKVDLRVNNVVKPHTLRKLSSGEQGSDSVVFKLNNGYNGTPAVLKAMQDKANNVEDIEKEIDYAYRVGIALTNTVIHSPDGDTIYCLVMKDLREGNPPLKFFHEWYLQDQSMSLKDELPKLRAFAKQELLVYAQTYDLLFFDVHLTNFFVDRKRTKFVPIDLSPPRYLSNPPITMAGVEDIKGLDRAAKSKKLQEYEEFLRLATRKRDRMSLEVFHAVVTEQFQSKLRMQDQHAVDTYAIY